jgi:hypothetical protein
MFSRAIQFKYCLLNVTTHATFIGKFRKLFSVLMGSESYVFSKTIAARIHNYSWRRVACHWFIPQCYSCACVLYNLFYLEAVLTEKRLRLKWCKLSLSECSIQLCELNKKSYSMPTEGQTWRSEQKKLFHAHRRTDMAKRTKKVIPCAQEDRHDEANQKKCMLSQASVE